MGLWMPSTTTACRRSSEGRSQHDHTSHIGQDAPRTAATQFAQSDATQSAELEAETSIEVRLSRAGAGRHPLVSETTFSTLTC